MDSEIGSWCTVMSLLLLLLDDDTILCGMVAVQVVLVVLVLALVQTGRCGSCTVIQQVMVEATDSSGGVASVGQTDYGMLWERWQGQVLMVEHQATILWI